MTSSKHTLLAMFLMTIAGCQVTIPGYIKTKIADEAAIHDGYARIDSAAHLSEVDLRRILAADILAWHALDVAANGSSD